MIIKKISTLSTVIAPLSLLAQSHEQPNILIIQCDQLTKRIIESYGQNSGITPSIDSVARTGVVFNNAYVTSPLSQPSRASLWTGEYPHKTGVISNSAAPINPYISEDIVTLGELFVDAGYRAVHFGKTHDMGTLRGFEVAPVSAQTITDPIYPLNQDSYRDVVTTAQTVEFLSSQTTSDRPFICVADLINPHNICGYVGAYEGEYRDSLSVPAYFGELPELPANFKVENWESLPIPIQYLCCTHRRLSQSATWTPLQYQHYLAAYNHYCSMVSKQIDQIIAALHSTTAGENTIIVIMADHGDSLASHQMVSKHLSFYEEVTNVPFIVSGVGIAQRDELVEELASVSLDLLPTLCSLAGIEIPESKIGVNWAPLLRGERAVRGHDYVVSQWHTEYEYTVSPGRMLRTKDYKYIHYLEGNGEELYDMQSDRGEMNNLASDKKSQKILKEHRKLLKIYTAEHNDNYFELEVKVDPRHRAHEPGYHNHVNK